MKFLDDLKRRMTTPGAEAFGAERFREAERGIYSRGSLPPPGGEGGGGAPTLVDMFAAARRRRLRIVMGIALLVVLVVSTVTTYVGIQVFRERRTVSKNEIRLSLQGPGRVVSGEEVTLRLKLENASHVGWENVGVEFTTPEGFGLQSASPLPVTPPLGPSPASDPFQKVQLTWAVGALPSRASAEFVITGRLFGEEGGAALFTAKVHVTPVRQPGQRLENSLLATVGLAGIPVDLTIDLPLRVPSGTPVTVRVGYQNRTARDLEKSRIVLDVPGSFAVTSATPPVNGPQLVWDLAAVPPQGQGEVTVAGVIEGEPDSVKPFVARVGFLAPTGQYLVQRQIQRSITIARTALGLTQALNGAEDTLKVGPGASIAGVVRYTNTGTAGLREVIVRLTFEGTGYDVSSVRADGGFFDSQRREITWSTASKPALRAVRPGETGVLGYSFRILPVEALPFTGPDDRNFTVITRAVGDTPDLPLPPGAPKQVPTDRMSVLINTVPTLQVNAFYDDGRAGLPRSHGPLPPVAEQETTYTVRVRVRNTSNEVIDGVYQAALTEGVRWVGKEYHTTGEVSYNPRTQDISWNVPLVAAWAGPALPAPEFAYQVAVKPSLNQVGAALPLTHSHTFEATDAFTVVRVRAAGAAVSTETAAPGKGAVVR